MVERRKQIEIEEQEIRRKEKELMSTVKLPAEAEAYKVQTIAEGKRTQTVEAARAEAERVRLTGAAEARAIEAVGRAEAESMRMKASAYKQYGDAAIMSLVLEALPQIAAEVAVSQHLLIPVLKCNLLYCAPLTSCLTTIFFTGTVGQD